MTLKSRIHLPALCLFSVLCVSGLNGTIGKTAAQDSGKPGDFDYYVMVLSWSPTFCAGGAGGRNELQCNGQRPYAFVLHGLWPQYERGYPVGCRTKQKPWVGQKTIDAMLDIMPSPGLVIHEYKQHGTCSGLDPKGYFDLARSLYSGIKIPEKFKAPAAAIESSPADVEAEFLKANPKLQADQISIGCGKRGALSEIKICFSTGGTLRACGKNEDQARACAKPHVTVPPVRAGKSGGGSGLGDSSEPI